MERTRNSSRKPRKVSDGEKNMPSIDRLSGLPDAVICHILSFLPTKISVATSILARRWRFLWANVPNLDFDCKSHGTKAEYSDIISRVMLLHKVQGLNTFRISFTYDCPLHQLQIWITTSIARHVQKIDLYLFYQEDRVPQCLFTCKALVDLRLHHCIGIAFTGTVSLPSLKKLHLYYIEYRDDEALPYLLSGCPVLEELIIDGIADSPTITRLTVNIDDDYYGVKINDPALRYIQVYILCKHISLSPMASLIEADICLENYDLVEENNYYSCSVLKFIDDLCNVKCLKLSGHYTEELLELAAVGSIVRFDNLTKLELAADWRFLIKFLESADNLEVLIIRQVDDHKNRMEPIKAQPACRYSLRTIRMDRFRCTEHEFNMVRYLLRNLRAVKRMEIYSRCGIGLKEKFDALQRISLFHRGSRKCELAFY